MAPRIQIPDPHHNVMDPQHCLNGSPCRRRQPVLKVREYLRHEACFSTSSRVHIVYRTDRSPTTSGQRKNPTHPPQGEELLEATSRQRVGRSPTIILTPSFPSFAPYAPQWLTAIGICPFSLIPDYSLYVMSVLILYPWLVSHCQFVKLHRCFIFYGTRRVSGFTI